MVSNFSEVVILSIASNTTGILTPLFCHVLYQIPQHFFALFTLPCPASVGRGFLKNTQGEIHERTTPKTKPQARRKRRAFFVPGFRQREMGRFLSQAFSPRRQEKQQMSQKSANMARRLFADQTGQSAARGRDGRCVMGDENSVRNNSLASDAMRPRMMRIRFGLILKITERMKSYAPLKLQYFTKQPDSRAKLSLFSGSHPNYSIIPTFHRILRF